MIHFYIGKFIVRVQNVEENDVVLILFYWGLSLYYMYSVGFSFIMIDLVLVVT